MLRIGHWRVIPSQNRIVGATHAVAIEPRAMDVLLHLARHAGEVVSIDDLHARVWKGAVVGDGSVYLAINQLRRALDDPTTRHIETIPKRGYRLVAPVDTTEPCIAVLPFGDLTADPEHAHFATGLAVELANTLGRVRGLQVVGLTSTRRIERIEDVAALDVDHVVDGTVRRHGGELRITVRLMEARTLHQLWSQNYERTLPDIFAIQDDIARAVGEALQIALAVGDLGRTPGMTRNVAAYDEYLKAQSLNLEWRPDAAARAIEQAERAVAIDPSFAVGWAFLRTACANGAIVHPGRADDWRRKGEVALERALALSPDAPDVLLEAGIHETERGNWLAAGAKYERLTRCYAELGMPDRAVAPHGVFWLAVGRAKEAVDELERARAIDPLVVAVASFLSRAYLAVGNVAAALAEVDRGLRLGGLAPVLHNVGLAAALAADDRTEIAKRSAACVQSEGGQPDTIRRAQWAAYRRDNELALELLTSAITESKRTFALWQPLMRDVRELPGFKSLVRDLGLVDYWRAFGWCDFARPLQGGDFVCE